VASWADAIQDQRRALKKEIIAKLLKRERKAIRQIGGPSMIYHPPSHKGETDG